MHLEYLLRNKAEAERILKIAKKRSRHPELKEAYADVWKNYDEYSGCKFERSLVE